MMAKIGVTISHPSLPDGNPHATIQTMQNLEEKTVRLIHLCFYALFLFTPLIFTPCTFLPFKIIPCTFELFEFNKMMFVYALTTIITGSWLIHAVATKTFTLRRTPFDIPLALLLLSQTLSTVLSIEPRTSLIGYYSRFHGGLFSTLSYLILFYAFATFVKRKHLTTILNLLLTSTALVAFYAIAQHFGIDARFWVQDVQRRVFSSLGQPNWLAAFLLMVIPLSWALSLTRSLNSSERARHPERAKRGVASLAVEGSPPTIYYILFAIFYLTLLYTKSRSGLLGFALSFVLFWGLVFLKSKLHSFPKKIFILFSSLVLILSAIDGLSWIPTINNLQATLSQKGPSALATPKPTPPPLVETGGSDSGVIRQIVWQGAIDVWRHYPILGSGVETFAYSYYNFRPPEHNLVSEWDFLYNKAHNEYLNFLATTGLAGLGTYLLLQSWFVIYCLKQILGYKLSTVTVGWLSFIWPALAVTLTSKSYQLKVYPVTKLYGAKSLPRGVALRGYELNHRLQLGLFILVLLAIGYVLLAISKWWYADTRYALGKQYEDASLPSEAYPLLAESVRLMPQEPNFRAELSKATADLAYLFYLQGATESAATMADISLAHSDLVQKLNPVHLNLIKARIRVLLTLNTFKPELTAEARATLDRGLKLAPTDPKLYYNLALLELKVGHTASAEGALQKTLDLKPDYEAARFAYATFLEDQEKYTAAVTHFQFILDHINPQNQSATDHLEFLATQSAKNP
ncbi:MAG: O-antigen ligase family protein [Candidatus Chisholmbacteria bacterium]|nr:O-antigen ligase family protein [Candidatus Chisholmbacteria bacterium]